MDLSGETDPSLPRGLTSTERSEGFVVEFFSGLIEGGPLLAETLDGRATHAYTSQGHTARMTTIPEELLPYVQSDHTSLTADLRFTRAPEQRFNLTHLLLQPDDGPELSLNYDGFATNVKVNGELQYFALGSDLLDQTLFSILPHTREHATRVRSVAEAIYTFSPFSTHYMELVDGGIKFVHQETETQNDSSHDTTIDLIIPHPSGKKVVFKTSVKETLRNAIGGIDPSHALEISVGEAAIAFSEIIDGQIIDVDTPRLQHAFRVQAALERLFEKNLGY